MYHDKVRAKFEDHLAKIARERAASEERLSRKGVKEPETELV